MIAEFMSKADGALVSAKLLLDAGDSDGAANRAYYAMFDAYLGPFMGWSLHDARPPQNP
jgi:hypothetical protein